MSRLDTFSLAGKVAIVTGSGRETGIGASIAQTLARNGASVVLNYVSNKTASRAEDLARKIQSSTGAKVLAIQADVGTQDGAKKLANETLTGFGVDQIDILVNNAGSGAGEGILAMDLSSSDIEQAFKVNALSALYMAQAVTPHMPRGGRIVNIGTVVSRYSNLPGLSIYGASKAAQDYLTASLAYELGRSKGITVNTVAPGGVMTDAGWYPEGEMRDTVAMNLMAGTKVAQRAGEPQEIANVVLLVVSEQSSWITGQYIAASGGVSFM